LLLLLGILQAKAQPLIEIADTIARFYHVEYGDTLRLVSRNDSVYVKVVPILKEEYLFHVSTYTKAGKLVSQGYMNYKGKISGKVAPMTFDNRGKLKRVKITVILLKKVGQWYYPDTDSSIIEEYNKKGNVIKYSIYDHEPDIDLPLPIEQKNEPLPEPEFNLPDN